MRCEVDHLKRRTATAVHAGIVLRGRRAVVTAMALLILAIRPAVAISACVGDCTADSQVTVDELITMVNVALGTDVVSSCMAGDANTDLMIGINEIVIGPPGASKREAGVSGDFNGNASNFVVMLISRST